MKLELVLLYIYEKSGDWVSESERGPNLDVPYWTVYNARQPHASFLQGS